MILWPILLALLLVAFAGLLAAADSAISALSRADIQELALTARAQRSLLAIAAESGAHVNAISFLRVTSETTAAVVIAFALVSVIEEAWLAVIVAALVMTAVSFVLVGSSPRSVGRAHARVVLRFAAPVVRGVRVLLGPIADALVALGNWVTPGRPRTATFTSEEQLLSMVDEATELDVLEEDDRELIHSIFEFNETVIREVMVPRTDMVTIDRTETVSEAMDVFLSRGYSRLPVTEENDPDDIVGILYLRDLARLLHEHPDTAMKSAGFSSEETTRRSARCSSSRTTSRWWSTSTAASQASSRWKTSSRSWWARSPTSTTARAVKSKSSRPACTG
jgi:CBS domain containing-hemolysin-like protein